MKPRPATVASGAPAVPAAGSTSYADPHAAGVLMRIRAQPRAAATAIEGPHGTELKVRVAAPPVDDAANVALERFLAEVFGCPRGAVQIVRGQKSRSKIVLIRGLTVAEVARRVALATRHC